MSIAWLDKIISKRCVIETNRLCSFLPDGVGIHSIIKPEDVEAEETDYHCMNGRHTPRKDHNQNDNTCVIGMHIHSNTRGCLPPNPFKDILTLN